MPDVFKSQENEPKLEHALDVNITPEHKKEKHAHGWDRNVLGAFRYYPYRANFINKDVDEEVVLILRRHPITNLRWVFILLVMLFAPVVLQFFPLLSFMPDNFQFISVVFYYLIVVAFGFEEFLMWFFNVNIITDERVVDVNFSNLVYRETPEADLDQIQDITVRVGSVIRTIFGYGDVLVQTASETQRIAFEAVPNPDRVAKILRDLRENEEAEKEQGKV